MKKWSLHALLLGLVLLISSPALALADDGAAAQINSGDTAFILVSAALVMIMTPGLALFYGGMSRKKNVLSTIMYSFITLGVITVQWAILGYSLAFGSDVGHIIGGLGNVGLQGVAGSVSGTIPTSTFMVFQMMFAIITAALISGSIAERMRFPAYLAFIALWTTIIYDPVAHWVWGAGGWLLNMGALDFAGGTVVHILSGVSGLVACLVIGKRKGYGTQPMIPHNIPMVVLGAALLWFGWFGFNAGSALSAGELASNAFVVTQLSAGAAVLSWIIVEWIRQGKPTVLGAASGCIAGLVGITPASGFVTPMIAIIIGLVTGAICCLAVSVMKAKLGYDDSLDAFGVHGIGGTWGALATGLFADPSVNQAGTGVFFGNPHQIVVQLIGVVAAWAMAAVGTFIILKVIGLFTPLRATDEEQEAGLDISSHGEQAYVD